MSKKYNYIQDGLTDGSFDAKKWWGVLVIIVLVGSALYAFSNFTAVKVNDDLADIGADVFLKYLFIVVAVERAAAVFVGISRSQNKFDWSLRINRINEVLQKDNPHTAVLKQVHAREHRIVKQLEQDGTIGKIDDVPASATEEDYLGYLTSTKHAYEFQRAKFNAVTNRYVSRIVFFAGIVLATLGLSIFQDLFSSSELVSVWQIWSLKLADILVTGGFLGGGSAGLNAVANKMSEFINKP